MTDVEAAERFYRGALWELIYGGGTERFVPQVEALRARLHELTGGARFVCDETNNTPETIEKGLLMVGIIPVCRCGHDVADHDDKGCRRWSDEAGVACGCLRTGVTAAIPAPEAEE